MPPQAIGTRQFSFEFFPAKTEAGHEKLKVTAAKLEALKPDFVSVTYGAGGSTRDRTLKTVSDLSNKGHTSVAPHLSCVGDAKPAIAELLHHYQSTGIKRLVALRGDMPSGTGGQAGEFTYAADLVHFIRETTGNHFTIEVAAYPEVHPQAENSIKDLEHFKLKVEAGADSAITQYFFNVDAYEHFVQCCASTGIDIPIVPGIMPITNFQNLLRFSTMCGAEIPQWIRRKFEAYEHDDVSALKFGHEVVVNLCQRLLDLGCPGLHFYTMNQADPTTAIFNALSI